MPVYKVITNIKSKQGIGSEAADWENISICFLLFKVFNLLILLILKLCLSS